MSFPRPYPALLAVVVLLLYARPALAFGAGNIASISKVEGQNWRHGDIEDTLLRILMARAIGGKKFDKLNVSRVYFGNWLRDYSQAIDVGTVKSVSAEAIRLLLCVLGFLTFGYGSKEFEVTADRLGCYRPEDHIDNPKNYADNEDARQYDRRLRGPINERVELAIDPETGMKNYIANERANIMTSALHVRRLFTKCIELGRAYGRNRNKADLHEALRLLGTGSHCLEDFLAHSNYCELALIEMGEREVFPHVGRDTMIRLGGARGEVYPCVTGTFGGVDFLHSVTGEVSDKLTQNEIEELEGTLQNNARNDTSILENLLSKIPEGLMGGGDKKQKMQDIQANAANSQMQSMSVSPREPEEYTRYIQGIFKQIMPAIEFHDDLLKSISEAIDNIPVLPKIVEQLEEQTSVWVFTIMAPFVLPVIQQVKNELRTGSAEIIESSQREQHIVFNDDGCTDPTHSMLSKDHFSNILNEIAGRTASSMVNWVIPQLMNAIDDESVDIDHLMNRIIHGVLHHPAQRDGGDDGVREGRQIMFRSVEEWWRDMSEGAKDEMRNKLSRRGVQQGMNHREGVHDSGHGCGKPLGMHKNFAEGGTFEDKIASQAANAIVGGVTGGISDFVQTQTGISLPSTGSGGSHGRKPQHQESSSSGGLGGLISAVGSSLLGDSFKTEDTESFSSSRQDNNSYTESRTEYGSSGNRHGQADYERTNYSGGGQAETYRRSEQDQDRRGNTTGYSEEVRTETSHGGRYTEETSYSEQRTEQRFESSYQSSSAGRRNSGGSDSHGHGHGHHKKSHHHGDSGDHSSRREDDSYGRQDNYSRREDDYSGRQNEYSSRRNDEYSSGGNTYSSGGYGERRNNDEYSGRGEGSYEDNSYGRSERRRDDEDQETSGGGGYAGGYASRPYGGSAYDREY